MNPMFYFLLALTAVLAATANAVGPAIVDIAGSPLEVGVSYYVLHSSFAPAGGGLSLASLGDNQCPLLVGQKKFVTDNGIPVRFSTWEPESMLVHESEKLNIEMVIEDTEKICGRSTYWRFTPSSAQYLQWFVEAGRKPEYGEETPFIQIKKTQNYPTGYHIAFCLNVNVCQYVGIYVDKDGVRRLALRSEPIPFRFKKAPTETSSKTMSII